MTGTLFIMAKAPILGTVKTRLAAEIGEAAALTFHRETLFRVARLLAADPRWRTRLLVTPDETADDDGFWPAGIPRDRQGDGDLGSRMLRPLLTAAPGAPVVLIGSDIPGVTPDHIDRAIAALDAAPLVFGPSEDGGFWLVGAAVPPAPDLFAGVRWSTSDALSDITRSLDPKTWDAVDTLTDVDTASDLARWRLQVDSGHESLSGQS